MKKSSLYYFFVNRDFNKCFREITLIVGMKYAALGMKKMNYLKLFFKNSFTLGKYLFVTEIVSG